MTAHDSTPTKVCRKCGVEKPLTDFYLKWRGGKERHAQCHPCKTASAREHVARMGKPQTRRRLREAIADAERPASTPSELRPGEPWIVDGHDWSWAFVIFRFSADYPGCCVGSDGSKWMRDRRYSTPALCPLRWKRIRDERESWIIAGERHGLSKTAEYRAWQHIYQRCFNPNCPYYHRYGGRGITICERWRTSIRAFLEDMGPRPSPKHSIDRIDNDGNYEPGNCRWAIRKEQMRNTSANHLVTHDGQTKTLKEWSEISGIHVNTLDARLRFGWPIEVALTIQPRRAIRCRVRGRFVPRPAEESIKVKPEAEPGDEAEPDLAGRVSRVIGARPNRFRLRAETQHL